MLTGDFKKGLSFGLILSVMYFGMIIMISGPGFLIHFLTFFTVALVCERLFYLGNIGLFQLALATTFGGGLALFTAAMNHAY